MTSKIHQTPVPSENSVQVITPDGMHLISADIGTVAFLGRDFDISLFVMSPTVTSMEVQDDSNGPSSVTIEPRYYATGKVRVGPAAAQQLAGSLMRALRDVDSSAYDEILKTLQSDTEGQDGSADLVH